MNINCLNIFAFTDDGKVLKVACIIGNDARNVTANLIEEIQVIENAPIRKLSVVHPSNSEPKLLVVSDSKIRSIPLHRCDMRRSCK